MSSVNEASDLTPETPKTLSTRGARRSDAEAQMKAKPVGKPRAKVRPIRTLAIFGAVAGMVATVALPAYAAFKPQIDQAITLQQVAENGAQTLVVASDATSAQLASGTYGATTLAEIETKKAEEAAAQRAKEMAEAQARAASAASSTSSAPSASSVANLAMVPAGSGSVIWPLQSYSYIGDGFGPRGGRNHDGVDILAPAMTPIYAAADGVVTVSSEGYWGYGVAVVIDHQIGGQVVSTLYGHMTYGTRAVSTGDVVKVGQPIGAVGSTGSSTANHLHFEVRINGSLVDPLAWLYANAG